MLEAIPKGRDQHQ